VTKKLSNTSYFNPCQTLLPQKLTNVYTPSSYNLWTKGRALSGSHLSFKQNYLAVEQKLRISFLESETGRSLNMQKKYRIAPKIVYRPMTRGSPLLRRFYSIDKA